MRDKLFSWRNFIRRIGGKAPSYFKKLRWLMIALGAAGAALALAISKDVEIFATVPFYSKLSAHLIVCGIFGSILASLPVADNSKAIDP